MRTSLVMTLATTVAFLFSAPVKAGDVGYDDCYIDSGCDAGRFAFNAGGELVFVQPHLNNGEAFLIEDNAGDATVRNFDFDYDASPRVWLGVENDQGLGYRVRYFYYNQDADVETATVDDADVDRVSRRLSEGSLRYFANLQTDTVDESIGAVTGLELQTLDWETYQRLDFCTANVTVSGGTRWARTESDLGVATFDANEDPDENYFVSTNFEGWGPTVSARAQRPIGGNLSLFAGSRASVLFGESDVRVSSEDVDEFDVIDRDSGLFIAEVQMGAQYDYLLANGMQLMLRAGWEGQYWAGMPLATRMGENFSDSDELFVEGISLGAGLTY